MAQEIEPMMPDAYSQLAEVYMRMGTEHLEDATASPEEATRLDPEGSRYITPVRVSCIGFTPCFNRTSEMICCKRQKEQLPRSPAHRAQSFQKSSGTGDDSLDKPAGDIEQAEWLLSKAGKRNESVNSLIQKARLLIRKETLEEVERLLDRATKKEPSNHAAFAAVLERMAQGQIFRAFEALKTARERQSKRMSGTQSL